MTALGLEKDESTLAYSTQKIKGEELNRVKEINMITALAGKAAGVQVNKNSSGMGGSAKITLRGVRSVSGDNQPLYVIDGVPMSNTSPEQAYSAIGGTANAGNRDGGDGISNLNPEDVESISMITAETTSRATTAAVITGAVRQHLRQQVLSTSSSAVICFGRNFSITATCANSVSARS